MKIKRYILILVAGLLPMCMQAQRIKAFVDAGLTTSQVDGDELRGFKRNSSTFGVGALTKVGENLTAAMEINYARRGAYNAGGDPYNIKLTLDYVDVPLMLYYHDPVGDMYFGAGLLYGRLVHQPHGTIQFTTFVPDTNDMTFDKDDLAFALEFRFRMVSHLYMSVRWQRSFISVNEWHFTHQDETWSNKCYNSSASVRLQWVFGEQDQRYTSRRRK